MVFFFLMATQWTMLMEVILFCLSQLSHENISCVCAMVHLWSMILKINVENNDIFFLQGWLKETLKSAFQFLFSGNSLTYKWPMVGRSNCRFVSLSVFPSLPPSFSSLPQISMKTVHHYWASFSLELNFAAGLSSNSLKIEVYNGNAETTLICW